MAETVYKIPLTNTPQRFEISLAGQDYIFISRWFSGPELWFFSLYDPTTEAVLLLNMPMITGINLLQQFGYLGIPGSLICYTTGDTNTPPGIKSLGDTAHLYYILEPDSAE